MSDYNMGGAQAGQSVDWYTPSTAGAYGNYGGAGYAAPQPAYGAPTYSSNAYDEEPPLLEELGIDLSGILLKTRAVLLHRTRSRYVEDFDMGGALMFVFLLGGLHLLMGRLHFGIILGWSVVHSMVLYFIVTQLAGVDVSEAKGLDLYSVCCLVGYCMLPICAQSAACLFIPRGVLSIGLAIFAALWAGVTAAKLLVRRCSALEDLQGVITFPCVLTYSTFALLALY